MEVSRKFQSFQSTELELLFYEMDRAVHPQKGVHYRSLSKFSMNCHPGNGQKAIIEDAVTCHVKGLTACRFGPAGMKTLAHVSGDTIGHDLGHDDYEWEKILFHPEIKGLGAETVALNLLAAKFNAPFKFKSTAPVPDANRYFHTWFQSTHNVRVGVVEGGHRCETAMRTFYGYKLAQNVPLVRLEDFTPIMAYSTLAQPFLVKVLQQDSKLHLMTNEDTRRIRQFSEESQNLQSQVVKATHKTMWWTMYTQCLAILLDPQYKYIAKMTNELFLAQPFEKSVQKDEFTNFIEAVKDVVINRYFDTEPGKTEMQDNDKAAFLAEVHPVRMQGRNFLAIKEVSEEHGLTLATQYHARSYPFCI